MSRPSHEDIEKMVAYDNPACALLLTILEKSQHNETMDGMWDIYVEELGEEKALAHMNYVLSSQSDV